MTTAVLIPWAQTDWQAVGRFASQTPLSINAQGKQQIVEWAGVVAQHRPVVIYALEKGPSEQTAQRIAQQLEIKVKKSSNLEEVALGLWEGLTPEQLKKRFAKAYKQWKDDPSSICPPEGEDLSEADHRLITQLRKITKKHDGECFGIVLGQLSLRTVRCRLEGKGYGELWNMLADAPVKYDIDLEENKAVLAAQSKAH